MKPSGRVPAAGQARTSADAGATFVILMDGQHSNSGIDGTVSANGSAVKIGTLQVTAAAARQLDQLLLAQLVDAMLPDDSSVLFGSGSAGEAWRSMLVDAAAAAIAPATPLTGTRDDA